MYLPDEEIWLSRIDTANLHGYFEAGSKFFSRRDNPRFPLRMLDQQNAEAVFLAHVDWIDRVAARASRRYGLQEEAEDFAAWVRMKFIEDDYAVLRKFRGESDLRTFIVTVVAHHATARSRERRGRWRPSAAALRRGPPAPALEALVRRDHYTLSQAGEKLRTEGQTTLSDLELARLLEQLPERDPLRPEEVEDPEPVLDAAEGGSRGDDRVTAGEEQARQRAVRDARLRALKRLTPEERMIVNLHFREGRSLADVARLLHLEQKPLYRRVPRLRERFRQLLEEEGVSSATVRELRDGGER